MYHCVVLLLFLLGLWLVVVVVGCCERKGEIAKVGNFLNVPRGLEVRVGELENEPGKSLWIRSDC